VKQAIHPEYHDLEISCACGSVLAAKSTTDSIRLEICGACHPFFTGTQKIVDSEGRVERFNKKYKGFSKK
jgi:large subunit ribosomal protein L31